MDISSLINGVEPEQGFSVLPAGNYNAEIEGIETKDTKSGGKALNVKLNVTEEGKYKGRKVFDWINIDLPSSPIATEIGRKRLARISQILKTTDLVDMIGMSLSVNLKVRKDEVNGDSNQVAAYNEFRGELPKVVQGAQGFTTQDVPW